MDYIVRSPESIYEWSAYFQLRWQNLRQPWGQPLGSEQDNFEGESFHLMAIRGEEMLGVGRIHLVSSFQAQVRYMAVKPESRGMNVGKSILQGLENYASKVSTRMIVLNAREEALKFYKKNGYFVTGEGETLFESIRHWKMQKNL